MLEPGTIFIWLIRLDQLSLDSLPNPSAEEQSRAASFIRPLTGTATFARTGRCERCSHGPRE